MKRFSLRDAGLLLLETVLVAALAISLAHWTWVAVTPRATAASALAEQPVVQPRGAATRQLFGAAEERAQPVANAGGGLALIGVFAERRPGSGRAIFARQGSRPSTVAVGETIEGLELREVYPDHVVIHRAGKPVRIDLERRTAFAAPPVAPVPARK